MKLSLLATFALALTLTPLAHAADAVTLHVGDAAPELAPPKWLKGEKVEKFEQGKIYVVEFWATWCGPCRQSIPHITELQKKNPEVAFIGMDCMEQDWSKAPAFVEEMGDKMAYRVAQDDQAGTIAKNWMEAAGQNGIPCAFVVGKDSKIEWIGHPMGLEDPLKEIVAGTYDRKKAAAEAAVQEAADAKMKAADAALEKIGEEAIQRAAQNGDLAAIDKMLKDQPAAAPILSMIKFQLLMEKKDFPGVTAVARDLVESNKDNSELLNMVAWSLVDPDKPFEKPDLDLALKAATSASEAPGGNNAAILDTLARVHFVRGDIEKAITTQTKAVEKSSGEEKEQLEKTLATYKSAKK